MLYPIEETYKVKVVDGGFSQLLMDMMVFCFKFFLFFFVAWTALFCSLWVWADYANRHLTLSCVSELANLGKD